MFFTLSFCQIVKVPSIFLYLETQNRHFLKQTQILQSLIHTRLTLTIFLFSLRPTLAGLKPFYVINSNNSIILLPENSFEPHFHERRGSIFTGADCQPALFVRKFKVVAGNVFICVRFPRDEKKLSNF